MKKLIIFGIMLALVLTAGCVQQQTKYVCPDGSTVDNPQFCVVPSSPTPSTIETSNNQIQEITTSNEVTTLDIYLATGKSWDADADVDGLSVTVQPLDSEEKIVKTDGTYEATLWKHIQDANYKNVKGDIIGSWSGSVKSTNYKWNGIEMRLEYNQNVNIERHDTGWLELTFRTSNGKSFEAKDEYVFLGDIF